MWVGWLDAQQAAKRAGRYQFHRTNSDTRNGRSGERTIVASSRMPKPTPVASDQFPSRAVRLAADGSSSPLLLNLGEVRSSVL
jgi:hypothetical protein